MQPKGYEVRFLNRGGKPIKIVNVVAVTGDMAVLYAEKQLPPVIAKTYDRASVRPI